MVCMKRHDGTFRQPQQIETIEHTTHVEVHPAAFGNHLAAAKVASVSRLGCAMLAEPGRT
jgi:hypothetical protein